MEVNVLIKEYEKLKVQNEELLGKMEEERKDRRELLIRVGERDRLIDRIKGTESSDIFGRQTTLR